MRATDSEWEMLCNGFGELTDKELCDKVAESILQGDDKTLFKATVAILHRMKQMSDEELDNLEKYAKDMAACRFFEYEMVVCAIPPIRLWRKENGK